MQFPSKKTLAIGITALTLALLPNLLSTKVGNSLVAKVIADATHSKCYLEGKFSYFKPQTINSLKIVFDYGSLEASNIVIEGLSAMIFSQKSAEVIIPSFIFSQSISSPSLDIKTCDLSVNIPKRPLGIYANINLENGIFKNESDATCVHSINGQIFYSSKSPIDLKIDGKCGDNGIIKLAGQFDQQTQGINAEVTIQNGTTDIIPETFIKPLITSNFDFYLSYNGLLNLGHAIYRIDSPDLSMQGQFDLKNKTLIIKDTNTLDVKRSQPYLYKDCKVENLSGQIVVKGCEILIDTIPQIKNIDCQFFGSTGLISYQNKQSGPFKITGSLSQNQDDVLTSAILTQNNQEILSINGLYSIKEAILKNGSIKADKFPLIFPLGVGELSIGNYLSFSANLEEKNGVILTKGQGVSPNLKNLAFTFALNKTLISQFTAQAIYDDTKFKLDLQTSNLNLDLENIDSLSGNVASVIYQIPDISQQALPIKIEANIGGLEYIQSSLKSPYLNLNGVGSYEKKSCDFVFKDTWQGQITLPSQIDSIKFAKDSVMGKVTIPSGSRFSNIPFSIKFDPFYLNSPKDILVKDVTMQSQVALKDSNIKMTAKAIFSQKDTSDGNFDASVEVIKNKLHKASVTLKNPPLEALSGLNPQIAKTSYLFGKNLVLDFDLKDGGQNIDVIASSENLKLQGAIGIKDRIFVTKPIKGSLHVKTLDLPFIQTNLPFQLKKPFDIGLEIKSLDIPTSSSSINDLFVDGAFSILNLSVEQNRKMVQMEALKASFSKIKGNNPLNVKIDADVFSSYDKVVTSGVLDASLTLNGLQGSLNNLDTSQSVNNFSFKLENFPTLTFDFLQSRAVLPFSSTFGETLNIKFDMNHTPQEGSFRLFASGKDTLLKLNASGKNSIYSLNDDVIFQTRLSPELSKFLFASKPLGIEKLTSDYPLVCRISSSGSQFSLFPFRSEMLTLSSCMFDFGRVTLDSTKVLPQTLSLLKSTSKGNNLSVWFQPIRTTVKNGLMNVSRFDFLVQDALQMAMWGDIDFNQRQVGLILGLTASCLQKAFGISELPKSYVMQIPVYGSFDDVKIDSKKATSKIAKILALQHGGNLLEQFGGKGGGAIGGMLKELSKIPDGDKKAPDAQTPFPWEKTSYKTSEKTDNKKAIRSSDSPIKQLMKVFF